MLDRKFHEDDDEECRSMGVIVWLGLAALLLGMGACVVGYILPALGR